MYILFVENLVSENILQIRYSLSSLMLQKENISSHLILLLICSFPAKLKYAMPVRLGLAVPVLQE